MPLNGQFIQLLATLSEIQMRKKQMTLQEKQYAEGIRQFEHEHQDKDITNLINQLVASTADSRQALLELNKKNLTPEQFGSMQQFAAAMPVDPRLLTAQSIGRGATGMSGSPFEALADREAAVRNATGGGLGALQQSQFQGGLFAGAPTPAMTSYAQNRAATGMDPAAQALYESTVNQGIVPQVARIHAGTEMNAQDVASNIIAQGQLGVARRQAATGEQQAGTMASYYQSQGEVAWAQLRQEDRKIAQEYGLNLLFSKGSKGAGGAGAGDMNDFQFQESLAKLADMAVKMGDPKTDAGLRTKLIGIFNTGVAKMGLYDVLGINSPDEAPMKVNAFRRWAATQGIGPSAVPRDQPPAGGNPMAVPPIPPGTTPPVNPMQYFAPQPAFPGLPGFPQYQPTPFPNPMIMRPQP